VARACEMKAIHKRLGKLEDCIDAERQRRAPGIAELLRQRYVAIRAAQGLPPDIPQEDTRHLSIAEILRARRARREREVKAERERIEPDTQPASR